MGFANRVLPPLAGTVAFFADPMAGGRGISYDTLNFMASRLMNWHFPNLRQLWGDIKAHPQYSANIIGGGIAAFIIPIAQSICRDLGIPIPSTLSSALSVIKKVAASACIGGTAAALVWLPGLQTGGPLPGGIESLPGLEGGFGGILAAGY